MTKEEIIKPENLVYKKPTLMNDNAMHYCPGCSHGVVHKLVAEVIEEMGMEEKTVGVSPVGCAVFAYNYLDIDWQEAAHGRAPAVATAIKRLWPDRLVFTYQGDGDLACIGTAETIHALNRGENITIIFINNAIYGMTGGQMAPTTLVGMKSSTCPYGRDVELHGYPLKITEIAAQLEGTAYVTRQSVQSVPAIRKAKKAIRKAFENSMNGKGSNLVEIVSTCSSGWKMTPEKSNKWMADRLVFTYQGDGDLACIGTAETIHALNRGENITIIFINNAIYGMTGGQMAPTTLVGMKSSTCPYGRDVELHGYPLKITEIAAQLEGTAYVTRQSVQSVPAIRKAKKAIRKAFENSMNGKGSNLVEIVSTCSSGWKMTPEKSNKWMEEHMFPFYPLGDLKDKE